MKMQHGFGSLAIELLVISLLGLGMVGCATAPPQATFSQSLSKEFLIDRNDEVKVTVHASASISIADYEKERLSQLIKQKIDLRKASSNVTGDARSYELDVDLTRYDKGDAFARMMLAGLGQIHIDAHIVMLSLPDKLKISEFDISKTFAWGGIYGGSTRIEDVEIGFADGVAESVTAASIPQKGSDI